MATFTALTLLNDKCRAETLGLALESLDPEPTGVGVFELEDGSGFWEVGCYFDAVPDAVGLALLAAAYGANDFVVSELPETDWVAHVRRELHPVRAGRFFVHGSHDSDKVPTGAEPLLIEASMAFGTGHHGTTQGCLHMLEEVATSIGTPPRSILDLGCGTAVLAMSAARAFPGARVLASDVDPVAVDVAKVNLKANRLEQQISCFIADGMDHEMIAAAMPFDLVFANILKGPLIDLAPEILNALRPGGTAILSGLLNEQAKDVSLVYRKPGNNVVTGRQTGEWTTLKITKSGRINSRSDRC